MRIHRASLPPIDRPRHPPRAGRDRDRHRRVSTCPSCAPAAPRSRSHARACAPSSATTLVRVGNGVPAGSDLAFLAVEPAGNLVVTDRARKSVLRFDASGHLLSEWGPRLGELALSEPAGVAVDGDAYYVLDRGSPRIFRLDANGRLQSSFSLEAQGTYGLNGLAVDPDGNLYVADTGRNRILVYSPSGALLRQFGHQGSGLGEFTQPMALAFLPDGSFVVSDWENSRLERWDHAFTATDAWSIGFHAFGVAADQDGRVYAPDPERRRVEVYSSTGTRSPSSVGRARSAWTFRRARSRSVRRLRNRSTCSVAMASCASTWRRPATAQQQRRRRHQPDCRRAVACAAGGGAAAAPRPARALTRLDDGWGSPAARRKWRTGPAAAAPRQ